MEAKYEHIKKRTFDADYKIVEQCIDNCPACAFKAGMREVVEFIEKEKLIDIFRYSIWRAKLRKWGLKDAARLLRGKNICPHSYTIRGEDIDEMIEMLEVAKGIK